MKKLAVAKTTMEPDFIEEGRVQQPKLNRQKIWSWTRFGFVAFIIFSWLWAGYPQFFGWPPGPSSLWAQQFGRPNGNAGSTGGWSGGFGDINDVSPNDSTFIESTDNNPTGNYFQVSISDLDDPGTNDDHIVRYRYSKDSSGGRSYEVTAGLYQGSTLIASWVHTNIPATPVTQSQTLTTTQAGNITDYSDLILRLTISNSGGGQPRDVRWYWAEVEVPDVVAGSLADIDTNAATGLGQTSVTGQGNITDTGGGNVTQRGFVWSTTSRSDPGDQSPGASDYEDNVSQSGSFGTGSFSLSISGLSPGQTYYYRAFAQNSEGYSYGDELSFTTTASLSTVTTSIATSVSQTGVTGQGNITNTGGANATERGFVWSTASQSNPGNTAPGSSDYSDSVNESGSFSTGAFSLSITGLDPDTTYYYRAYSLNSAGYSYGNEIEFSTLGDFPVVTTLTADGVGLTAVTGRGNIIDIGANNPTERGFVWSTSSQSNPGNTAPGSSAYSDSVNEGGSFSTGAFSLSISGLDPNTTYYYRAYALNAEGYSYGSQVTFQTLDEFPEVTTTGAFNIQTRQVTGSGNIVDDKSTTVTERGFVWSTASQSNPGNTAPGSSAYSDSVNESGSFSTGAFSLSISGLDPDTTYYYRAYSLNAEGYGYGNEVSFTTATAQFSRPDGTVTNGTWSPTPLYQQIDSVSQNDSSFISSADNTSPDTAEIAISEVGDPGINTGHILRYTYRKDDAGGHAINFRIRLLDGSTEIAEWVHTNIGTSFTLAEQTLSEAEAGSITDYSNLRIEVSREGDTGGPPGNRRSAQVSWVELELPEPAPTDRPTVVTSAVSNLGVTTVDGQGNVTNTGNLTITRRGFVFATTSQAAPGDTAPESTAYQIEDESGSFGGGSFGLTLSDLEPGTVYFYRAFAQNAEGYSYGGEVAFQTYIQQPTVTTSAPTNISAAQVDGQGQIIFIGSSSPTERGFVWSTSSQSNPGNTAPAGSGYSGVVNESGTFSAGSFSLNISGLSSDTVYYYRAYALNAQGYSYGAEIEFQTTGVFASMTTNNPTGITETEAQGQGVINNIGLDQPTERGFVWATVSQANPGDTDPAESAYGSMVSQSGSFSAGSFSLTLSGLEEGRVYFYRAFSLNSAGYSYGNEVVFNTLSTRPTLLTGEPSNVTFQSAIGVGDIVSTGIDNATERGFVWATSSQADPGDTAPVGTGYNFNVSQGGDFGVGSFSLTLSGLDDETTYYYRAYARNSDGYGYGNEIVFVTPQEPLPPEITDLELNGNEEITLLPGVASAIPFSATITDPNGFSDIDQSSIEVVVYRSGVTGAEGCSADENNCYYPSEIDFNCSGNSCDIEGIVDLQFFAEPTDDGSPFSAETWIVYMYIEDLASLSDSAFSGGVNLMTLLALDVPGDINYGSLALGQNTGSVNQQTTVRNAGNAGVEVLLYGEDMTLSSSVIDVINQKWALMAFSYLSEGQPLTDTAESTGIELVKPTSTTPISDVVFWGLGIPDQPLPSGEYEGINYFIATEPG